MSKKLIYPAVFLQDDDGITITFPDLPGCISCAATFEEAYDMAKEVFDGNVEPLVLEEAQESEIAVITNPMPYGMIKNKISDLEAKGVCVLSALRIGDL